MHVYVDNVWATPSTLHMRVHVWGVDNKWRRRFDCHVPLSTIPPQALEPLLALVKDELFTPDDLDQPVLPGEWPQA